MCAELCWPRSPGCRLQARSGSEPVSFCRGCVCGDRSLNLSVSRHLLGLAYAAGTDVMGGGRRGGGEVTRGRPPLPSRMSRAAGRVAIPPECLTYPPLRPSATPHPRTRHLSDTCTPAVSLSPAGTAPGFLSTRRLSPRTQALQGKGFPCVLFRRTPRPCSISWYAVST